MSFKEGKAYFIRALDHSVGLKQPMEVAVVGWVIKQDKESVLLSWWVVSTDNDYGSREENLEPFVIMKSCIKEKKELKGLPTYTFCDKYLALDYYK